MVGTLSQTKLLLITNFYKSAANWEGIVCLSGLGITSFSHQISKSFQALLDHSAQLSLVFLK